MTRTKTHSPAYPATLFRPALDRMARFAKRHGSRSVDEHEACRAIGYTTISGAAIGRLNALKHYGLLEKDDHGYRASRLAHMALGAGTPEEVLRAQFEAAWRPEVLQRLRVEVAGKQPEEIELRSTLVALGYAPKAAQRIEKVYKALVNDKAFLKFGDDCGLEATTGAAGVARARHPFETLLQMREDGIRIFIDARADKVPTALRIVDDWLSRARANCCVG